MWQKSISTFDPHQNGDVQVVNGIEQATGRFLFTVNGALTEQGHTFSTEVTREELTNAVQAGKEILVSVPNMNISTIAPTVEYDEILYPVFPPFYTPAGFVQITAYAPVGEEGYTFKAYLLSGTELPDVGE